ncbi:MAG: DUF1460 domain-containing protein [Deltaproteobacteria bacterium]|nr:DUF1460 domain-containing protein [Deltaproteobacteria bacterium]
MSPPAAAIALPLVLGLALWATPPPRALPGATNQTALPRFCDAAPETLPALVREVAVLAGVRSRVLSASERFLGVPYQFDPLGEGPGQPPDEDPRLRYDLADCQTFIETVLALARARSPQEVLPILDEVRYDGPVGYSRRNHFFEAQWVPSNSRKGYVREVTAQIAGKDAVRHVKAITHRQWKERTLGERIDLPEERAPIGDHALAYLPLAKVLAHAKAIPSGTLFAVVRADRPQLPTMVSHVGIVVQQPGGTFVRHAGRDLYSQVIDEQMAHFVERNALYTKWPVLGLQLLEVLERPASE